MIQHSHQTAPTQLVDVNGIRFAYRRFGKSGGPPLVFTGLFVRHVSMSLEEQGCGS
jgi:hypothetical protein